MTMRQFIRPKVLAPILAGLAVAALLFFLGNAQDAPGLSLIGFVAGFLLILWGIYNAGVLKKEFILPLLLLCFGPGGVTLSIALLLDGEFGDATWLGYTGIALGVLLLVLGIITASKRKGKKG